MKDTQFLVFWMGDGGDRESASVYYAMLVDAETNRDAKIKYLLSRDVNLIESDLTLEDYDNIGIVPIDDINHIN